MTALSAAGDLLGAVCLHQPAITCSANATQCVAVEASSLALAPCICDACLNFPKVYESMVPMITALQQIANTSTPAAEQTDSFLTAICPISSVLECLDSNSACSSALASMDFR